MKKEKWEKGKNASRHKELQRYRRKQVKTNPHNPNPWPNTKLYKEEEDQTKKKH
jgi:hypothetical protein